MLGKGIPLLLPWLHCAGPRGPKSEKEGCPNARCQPPDAGPDDPAINSCALPYDLPKPHATSGIQVLLPLTFKAGETEAQSVEDALNPRQPDAPSHPEIHV